MSKSGSSIAARVLRFNAGRDPELLQLKHRALRSDVFTLHELVQSLGKIVAWGELRSCGCGGASSIDDLVGYWGKSKKPKNVLRLAQWCAGHVDSQWQEYCIALDAGRCGSNQVNSPIGDGTT
jgi:hypothetical protein